MLGLVCQLGLHKKRMSQGIRGRRGLESAGEIIERERDADTRTCSKAHLCFDFASIDWIGMMENVGILHMVWW